MAILYAGEETPYARTMPGEDLFTGMSRILDGLSIQDACWYSTNEKGETVLHIAAREQDASVVAWILDRNPRLSKCRNLEGETPLDALSHWKGRERTVYQYRYPIRIILRDMTLRMSNVLRSCKTSSLHMHRNSA